MRTSALGLLLFSCYAATFIWRTSFVIDLKRYFVLFDDAMISMRYAWNLSHGLGAVWNAGERVEGFSNPLWVLLMSGATWAFDKNLACLAVQVMGASLLALGALMFSMAFEELARARALARHEAPPTGLQACRLATFLLCLAPYPVLYWSLLGMEVSLLTALLGTLFYVAAAGLLKPNAWTAPLAGMLAALCYLTRSDGVLLALPPLAWLMLGSTERRRQRLSWLLAPLCAAVAGATALRHAYYGELVPNTYVLKMHGMSLDLKLKNGFGFVSPFARSAAPLYIGGVLSVIATRDLASLSLMLVPLVLLAYQVLVGGDAWPYWRMLAPGLPCLVLLCMLATTAGKRAPRSLVRGWTTAVTVLATFGAVTWLNVPFAKEYWSGMPYTVDWNESNMRQSLVLTRILDRDARIAVTFAGTTPYATGLYAIDMLGKCDRYIARLPPDVSGQVAWAGMTSVPGHNKYDLTYSLVAKAPDYVERTQWFNQHLEGTALDQYVTASVGGVGMLLRRNSKHVDWSAVR